MSKKSLAQEIKEIIEKYRRLNENAIKQEKTKHSYPVHLNGGQKDAG